MRVLFSNESPLIRFGLAAGFIQSGHEVKVIQGESERMWGQPVEEQLKRFNRAIEKFRPDFIFTEGHPGFDIKTICEAAIRHGIPHLYWAIEDPVSTEYLSMHYARYVDYIFTTTVECIPRYQAIGKKAELLLFGCNPEFHHRTDPKQEYQHDIVLVATNYSSRYDKTEWFLLPLIERGYDIKVWGLWWDDPTRPINLLDYPGVHAGLLPYEELPSLYSSAKIILGMNCDDTSETQTSMRPYEALACGGGLYVAHHTKAQQRLFGDLIFQVKDTEETLRTVNMILGMDQKTRNDLACQAMYEVHSKHNYRLRAEQVIAAFQRL